MYNEVFSNSLEFLERLDPEQIEVNEKAPLFSAGFGSLLSV